MRRHLELIEHHTDCHTIALTDSGICAIDGGVFGLSLDRLDVLRAELTRIRRRGGDAIRRVKRAYVHNNLAGVLGLGSTTYSEGHLATSKWITREAAGADPLSDKELEALLSATTAHAAGIAAKKPDRLVRLQRDIQLVNLSQLITAYGDALDAGHKEHWWQRFFEGNRFILQLLFGGPAVFVDAQVPIGEGDNTPKGKKIADYLFKNPITSNAALVEIKKPSTRLVNKVPYREGVYGVYSEIGKSVTQVLDQALQLTRHEEDTKARTVDAAWFSDAPRCFVVAGRTSELDTADKRKSFELYREHLAGVRLVTYDELFEQLKMLRNFLRSDTAEGDPGSG